MYDVIIVGAGTVGLTIANLLANLGLSLCLIERRSHLNRVSNAVGVNDECLLAWQKCGIMTDVRNCIGFNDVDKTILKYLDENKREIFSLQQSHGTSGFPKGVVFLQNKIDEMLLKNLQGKIDLVFDESLISLSQSNDVVLIKTDKASYEAKYLIGADGKDSSVRKLLNVSFNKLSESKDEWLILNLLMNNRSLEKDFVEVYCGSRSVVSCPLPLDYHRIEISLQKDEQNILPDETRIRALLAKYLSLGEYQIIDKFKCRFITAIAEKFFQNRVVLCGDAAHCTSPFASAGLVSGIRDCLVLYEVFQGEKIDFSLFEKHRYRQQMHSLRLAMILEKLMRPYDPTKKLLFFVIRLLTKSAHVVKALSIR